jgi:hypothetical protein
MLNVIASRQLSIAIEKRGSQPVLVLKPPARLALVVGPPRDVVVSMNVNTPSGIEGMPGKSAYQVWLDDGHVGTVDDFLSWLRGADGQDGADGKDGTDGRDGIDGKDGSDGNDGLDGQDGRDGVDGQKGIDGSDGKSAYEIWLDNSHVGSEADFLEWLRATPANPAPYSPALQPGWSLVAENWPLVLMMRGDIVFISGVITPESIDLNGGVAFILSPEWRPSDTVFFTGAALLGVFPVSAMVLINHTTGEVSVTIQTLADEPTLVGPVFFNNSWLVAV